MNKPILNISEIEYASFPVPPPESTGGKFGGQMGDIGRRMGATKIGANVTVIPAGKRVFPFHNHHVNEEFLFVLEGEGTLRFGKEEFPIKKGDFILCPPGGAEVAHQVINTGKEEMRLLAMSTKLTPEIADYPDSGKFGILSDKFRYLGKADQSLGYWDGE